MRPGSSTFCNTNASSAARCAQLGHPLDVLFHRRTSASSSTVEAGVASSMMSSELVTGLLGDEALDARGTDLDEILSPIGELAHAHDKSTVPVRYSELAWDPLPPIHVGHDETHR